MNEVPDSSSVLFSSQSSCSLSFLHALSSSCFPAKFKMLEIENGASNLGTFEISCSSSDSELDKLRLKPFGEQLDDPRPYLSLLLLSSWLIASIDGKFALTHTPSRSKRSRTSQENMSGWSRINSSIFLVICGVISRHFEEGMAPGSIEPVS